MHIDRIVIGLMTAGFMGMISGCPQPVAEPTPAPNNADQAASSLPNDSRVATPAASNEVDTLVAPNEKEAKTQDPPKQAGSGAAIPDTPTARSNLIKPNVQIVAPAQDKRETASVPVYELHEDQVLKWIPPAQIGKRPKGKQPNNPQQLASEDIYEQEGTKVRLRTKIFGGGQSLHSVVGSLLRIFPCELTGDASVWMTIVVGDFVVRKDATREQLVDALNQTLRDDMKLEAWLRWEEQETDVWVIDGLFKPAPIGDPWRLPKDEYRAYVIFGLTGPGGGSHPSSNAGSFDELLKELGSRTGLPVVNELKKTPSGFFGWQTYYDESERTIWSEFPRQFAKNVDLVVENFQIQTGLRIRKTRQKVRLLKASIQ